MDHILFTHSFVNGLFSCFRVLAIANTATVNTEGACVSLNYGFLRGHAMIGKETGSLLSCPGYCKHCHSEH